MYYKKNSADSKTEPPANPAGGFGQLFGSCWQQRQNDPALKSTQAYRCFNGFSEGMDGLVIDRFDQTLVISNHSRDPQSLENAIRDTVQFALSQDPKLESILLKTRHSVDATDRLGRLVYGSTLPERIIENGTTYALDLLLNQDNSFYCDTRNLRLWLKDNCRGKSVLNTFAYTGSLGIAALAGGATALAQTDLNPKALAVARRSYQLNDFEKKMTLIGRDFFSVVNDFKKRGVLFDIVILDSPFFSKTTYGKVDLQAGNRKLINKVRPLVGDGGFLILINNALFVSGRQIMDEVSQMSASGYLTLDQIVSVPADLTGYPDTISGTALVSAAPFNHPTKICVLKVSRKDKTRANFQ